MYSNLVLSGGAFRGLGLLGGIKYLEELNLIKYFKQYIGSSAGAIISFLLIIGYTSTDIKDIIYKVHGLYLQTKNKVSFQDINVLLHDLDEKKEDLKFSDLELIFRDFKTLFEKKGFVINWKALEKQNLDSSVKRVK